MIKEFLGVFFSLLSDAGEAEPERVNIALTKNLEITLKKVRVKVFSVKP